jgi:predicted PurR-regulated permease PerM
MTPATPSATVPETPDQQGRMPRWATRLVIWGLFLFAIYLVRDFFFTGFLTFVFCYLILGVVGWGMARLSTDRDRPWLRRVLVLAVFAVVPVVFLIIGFLVGPRLLDQAQRAAGWFSNLDAETETARLVESSVGASEFTRQYGTPEDPRYAKGLEEFRATGAQHVTAYQDFPAITAMVEGSFVKQFTPAERTRARQRLVHLGAGSKEFTQWFLARKVPELQQQARERSVDRTQDTSELAALVRAAAKKKPEELLEYARHEPAMLAVLRQEWIQDGEDQAIQTARDTPDYQKAFRDAYDHVRVHHPTSIPYTFEQYLTLKQAQADGVRAFGDALEAIHPTAPEHREAQLRADFEAAKKHELFQQWWSTSSTATFLRHHLRGGLAQWGSDQVERMIAAIVNLPLAIGTALLLSLFICIDFPRLRQGVRALRDTWLRDVYDELAPAMSSLGTLIGRSLQAQGLIAMCNAVMMFLALEFLGVAHAALLSAAVFVLCLVPTLGMVISWALICGMALIQPGGGVMLAVKASGAVLVVIMLETFVFSPRILGKMMELHPVLIIAILPIAQYFFGVWGLILATPVAVFVLYEMIFCEPLPGKSGSVAPAGDTVVVAVPAVEPHGGGKVADAGAHNEASPTSSPTTQAIAVGIGPGGPQLVHTEGE